MILGVAGRLVSAAFTKLLFLPSERRRISHAVADANTTEPRMGALTSLTISSSENNTAARGELNAAAIAAAAPTGNRAFTFSGRSPTRRRSTDAMAART